MTERKVIANPPPLDAMPDAEAKEDVFQIALWMIAHDYPNPQQLAQAALDRFKGDE